MGVLAQKMESSLGGGTSSVSRSGHRPYIAGLAPSFTLFLFSKHLPIIFSVPGTILRSVHI